MTYYTSTMCLKLLTKEQMERWLRLNHPVHNRFEDAQMMGIVYEVTETSDPGDGRVLGFDVDLIEEMIPWENEEGETGESLHLKFETTWADKDSVDRDKAAFFESQHYTDDEIREAL